MRTMIQILAGAGLALACIAFGAILATAYGRWNGHFTDASSEVMDDITERCVRDGGFSWKGYSYVCGLDEAGQQDIEEAGDPAPFSS